MPDILDTFYSIHDVQDIIANGHIIQTLFKEKEKAKRVMPETKLFKIEISPINGHPDRWQKSADATGWVVPFKYALAPHFDNYNVRIKFKMPKFDPGASAHAEYLEIDYIEKEYTKAGQRYASAPGRVIEYYRPRGVYAGKVKANVMYNEDTKKVQFSFPDGTIETGYVSPGDNKFIEAEPYAKSYNEGQKRWWIEKSAGSNVYDKRKSVGQPKEDTGNYGSAASNYTTSRVRTTRTWTWAGQRLPSPRPRLKSSISPYARNALGPTVYDRIRLHGDHDDPVLERLATCAWAHISIFAGAGAARRSTTT